MYRSLKYGLVLVLTFLLVSCAESTDDKENTAPVASFEVNTDSARITSTFKFDASGSSDEETPFGELEFRWDFNNDGLWDSHYSFVDSVDHDFSSVGEYYVRLEVKDGDGASTTIDKRIIVVGENGNPWGQIALTEGGGALSKTFEFTAEVGDADDSVAELQVRWDFDGDNVFDTDFDTAKVVYHKYSYAQVFTVTMEVRDLEGLTAQGINGVQVVEDNKPPLANLTANRTTGISGTSFEFDASGSIDTDNLTDPTRLEVRWDFEGDGVWDTEFETYKKRDYIFNSSGLKTIRIEVRDLGDNYYGDEDYITSLSHDTTFQVTIMESGTLQDRDGNTYRTVKIGEQWWTIDNLKVTTYGNGDDIDSGLNATDWGNNTSGAYGWFNVDNYGLVYNAYAVNNAKQLAPEGWHIPTDAEWQQLESYLGMSDADTSITGYRGMDQANMLREVGTEFWNTNTYGTNESMFSARPAGHKKPTGYHGDQGTHAQFWTSTPVTSNQFYRAIYPQSGIYRGLEDKNYGFSIRLVKD